MSDNMEEKEELDVAAIIGSQAYATKMRFGTAVEQEDLQQEAWVWVLEHPAKIKEHKANENVRLAAYELGKDIWGVMDRYARKEKAQKAGYDVADDIFVSDAVINLVLPSVLKGDPTPPSRDGERVSNTSDPAEGGNWLATYLDVKKAWLAANLTGKQRDLMVSYYRFEDTQQELSQALGITQSAVARRLKAARSKLIDQLGGRKPREPESQRVARPGAQHQGDDIIAAMN